MTLFSLNRHFKAVVPNLLAPGTSSMEDSFFHGAWGGNGSDGNVNDGEWQRGEASLTCLPAHPPAAHLMLCSLVLKRCLTGSGPRSGG